MNLPFWRDVALVLLIIEAFILGLLPIAILYFAIKGMNWLTSKARHYLPLARSYVKRIGGVTERTSEMASAPLIESYVSVAYVRGGWRGLVSIVRKEEER
jgi:hypothetical protein